MGTDKITQDLQIFQQTIKAALADNSGDSKIVVNYIGQIRIGTQETEVREEAIPKQLEVQPVEEIAQALPRGIRRVALLEYHYDGLEKILENMPKPRLDALIQSAVTIAVKRNKTRNKAADWLGMERSRFYHWLAKFKLRHKDSKYE